MAPIDAGHETVLVPTVAGDGSDPLLPWDFSGLPIRGSYDDYGFVEKVKKGDPGLLCLQCSQGDSDEDPMAKLEESRMEGGFVLFSETVWDRACSIAESSADFPSTGDFSQGMESLRSQIEKNLKSKEPGGLSPILKSLPAVSRSLGFALSRERVFSKIEAACRKRPKDAVSILMAARDLCAVRHLMLESGIRIACGASGPQHGAWGAHLFASSAMLSIAEGMAVKIAASKKGKPSP